jgi:cyclopropane fatty-acyl-phospholipid synthase-like methyltransferase
MDTWSANFFSKGYYDLFDKLGKFKNTSSEVSNIISLMGLTPASHVLDIPCGFGRIASGLHKFGCHVVGVDNSDSQLDIAKSRYSGPIYIKADMRDPPPGEFDAILNLWTSFGYFATREEDFLALESWVKLLRKGGKLLIETTDLERAKFENRKADEPVSKKSKLQNGVLEESIFEWEQQLAHVSYIFNEERRNCVVYMYERRELELLLERAGLSVIGIYGGFDGRQKSPCDRLTILAQKSSL